MPSPRLCARLPLQTLRPRAVPRAVPSYLPQLRTFHSDHPLTMARVHLPIPLDPKYDTRVGRCSGAVGPAFPGARIETPIPDYLGAVLRECSEDNPGETAAYIPELRDADPNRAAICISTSDGFTYAAGDADIEFSIQSISKAFVYALALEEKGVDEMLKYIDVEPSGEAFNELSLQADTRIPKNPMINAGAITAHACIGPTDISGDERFELIRSGLSAFAGRELTVDESVFESELDGSWRNTAIACMLRNYKIITQDPLDIVRTYTRQCAVKVTTRDLALMAATLSNGGVQPVTGRRVVRRDVVQHTLSVMMMCGMYSGAGHWMFETGFPAKSGVAGGILGVLPGQVGIATFSPRLDKNGNSLRGVRMCQRLSHDMGMHIMSAPEPARAVVRRDYLLRAPTTKNEAHRPTIDILSLQGTINFTAAERVVRLISARSADHSFEIDGICLDFRSVYSVDRVAKRMLREVGKRIRQAGGRFSLIDPENLLDVRQCAAEGANLDEDCFADEILTDLTPFLGWERLQLPDSMKTMHMPKDIEQDQRL